MTPALSFVVDSFQQAAVDEHRTTGQREGVDRWIRNDFEGEREAPLSFASCALANRLPMLLMYWLRNGSLTMVICLRTCAADSCPT